MKIEDMAFGELVAEAARRGNLSIEHNHLGWSVQLISASRADHGSMREALVDVLTEARGETAALHTAAAKALAVMRAHGWHMAAAAEVDNDNQMVESLAAQEAHDELASALGVDDE